MIFNPGAATDHGFTELLSATGRESSTEGSVAFWPKSPKQGLSFHPQPVWLHICGHPALRRASKPPGGPQADDGKWSWTTLVAAKPYHPIGESL